MVATRRALLSLAAASSCLFAVGESRGQRFVRRNDTSPSSVGAATDTESDYLYPPDVASGSVTTRFTAVPHNEASQTRSSVIPVAEPASMPPSSDNSATHKDGPAFVPSVTREAPSVTTPRNEPVITPDLVHASPETNEPQDEATTPTNSLTTTTYAGPQGSNGTASAWNATTTRLPTITGTGPAAISGVPGDVPVHASPGSNVTVTAANGTAVLSFCEPSQTSTRLTRYTILQTWTTTFFGPPSSYVAPFPTVATPEPSCRDPRATFKLTFTQCSTASHLPQASSCSMSTSTIGPTLSFDGARIQPSPGSESQVPLVSTITDKNPAVVYSTIKTPEYNGGSTKQVEQHNPSGPGLAPTRMPDYGGGAGAADHTTAQPPVTLAVQPSGVVINGQTFTDDAAAPTRVVTVAGNAFTIAPGVVMGAGASINRGAAVGGVYVPTPTTTNMGGLDVVVSSSVAVIDGTTFAIPMDATTAVVKGQTVSLGPNGIAIASQTVPVSVAPLPTEVVIAGGDVITAIGQSVLVVRGTTITYGPDTASVTVVDGESITFAGATGVIVHGTTLGGLGGSPGETAYEIVGGATITEIGASLVVIEGRTFTVGPAGPPRTTTVVGGQTVTLGPDGVSAGSMTWRYPFGPTTTFTPGAGPTAGLAAQTSSKNAVPPSLAPPRWGPALFFTSIAIGVWSFLGL